MAKEVTVVTGTVGQDSHVIGIKTFISLLNGTGLQSCRAWRTYTAGGIYQGGSRNSG